MTSLSMMSSSQEECDRLKKATEDGNVDDIKTLASSGVDVNTSLGDDNVSEYYMLC